MKWWIQNTDRQLIIMPIQYWIDRRKLCFCELCLEDMKRRINRRIRRIKK